jgi:hypothetical protein
MLKTIAIAAGLLLAILVAGAVWLYVRAIVGGQRAYNALAKRIEPVNQALERGEDPPSALLLRFARDRETRKVLFKALESFEKVDLFPTEYRTWEHMAEADLVVWLNHPNELGATPSDIELVARVPEPGTEPGRSTYFVFRFRSAEPHWAAKDGWLAGVAGPYTTDAPAVPHAPGTFSRFERFDSRSPEEHVGLIHAAVKRFVNSAEPSTT